MPRPIAAKPKAAAAAAPAWQTAATILIILHLFCLGIGLASSVAGGRSLLAPALFRVPLAQQYLKLLWMNVGYDFHIASPLPEDGSHRLQLAAAQPGASSAAGSLPLPAELPTEDVWPRLRRQRYAQLAYHVAFLDELYADNSDIRTALPLSIAQRWLRELGAPHEPFVLTCVREPAPRLPKAIERAPSLKPREGGPKTAGPALFQTETITVYLVWDPESASYLASRAEPPGQTSEVIRTAAAGAGASDAGAAATGTEPPADAAPSGLPAIPPSGGAGVPSAEESAD